MSAAGITDLPPETLDRIARGIGPLDNVGCSAVCRAWRRAINTSRLRLLHRPKLPHYVCIEPRYQRTWWEAEHGEEKDSWSGKVCIRPRYCHRREDLVGVVLDGERPPAEPTRVIGVSSYGWVVTVDSANNLHIVEPLTGRNFRLPPLLTASASSRRVKKLKRGPVQGHEPFRKAALAPGRRLGTFAVVLIHKDGYGLSFLAPGAECWTELRSPSWNPRQYIDVALHKGCFYTLSVDSELTAWEPDTSRRSSGLRPRRAVSAGTETAVWGVLVESTTRENLLLVTTPLDGPGLYLGMAVKVSRLDERERRWIPQENSGDTTILAKDHSALCVSSRLDPAFSRVNWYDHVNFASDSPHDVPEPDGSLFLRHGCWFLPYVAPIHPHKYKY